MTSGHDVPLRAQWLRCMTDAQAIAAPLALVLQSAVAQRREKKTDGVVVTEVS
jgi:hypothetical protein